MSDIRARLVEAAGTGEIVSVVYKGGSQPGSRRDIVVRSVAGNFVEVVCLASNEPRKMRLDRIALWDGNPFTPAYSASAPRRARPLDDDERVLTLSVEIEVDEGDDWRCPQPAAQDPHSRRLVAGMSSASLPFDRKPVARNSDSDRLIAGMSAAGRYALKLR